MSRPDGKAALIESVHHPALLPVLSSAVLAPFNSTLLSSTFAGLSSFFYSSKKAFVDRNLLSSNTAIMKGAVSYALLPLAVSAAVIPEAGLSEYLRHQQSITWNANND